MPKNRNRRVFFTSDTHFGHRSILGYERPQFASVEEMDQFMIARWNETVGPTDLVYHLGDFAWTVEAAKAVRPRLNGTIRLIIGNHDDVPKLAATGMFQRMSLWRSFPEYGVHATHVPMRRQHLRHANFNVHGHVHSKQDQLEDFHINVSVEVTDFRPVPAHELRAIVARRGLTPSFAAQE